MHSKINSGHISKLSLAGLIITLGIVYGDIGTSPLYVLKAILAGSNGNIDEGFIIGSLSCIIWTLTLQTTLKYVIITLRADNKGEGGIFALYALIRKRRKGVFFLAIVGGAALLADGVITPSITVMSAVEGLGMLQEGIRVLPIVLVIIAMIFLFQPYGTSAIGKVFGPAMFIWFLMLAVLGFAQIIEFPLVIKAFNPIYAITLLAQYPGGFLLLGAVFLCTTGAEALYSDLGHCGFLNIRITWIYVKTSLILNYMGQGAWVLSHQDIIMNSTEVINPFFSIMPEWFLAPGILISTVAAIIASQAMITGSFTIISEAVSLNFWPRVRVFYPTEIRGQMYIPMVNWFLFFACVFVILYFQESSNMEAAYGLAITITMLMTTLLLSFYMSKIKRPPIMIVIFLVAYLGIEGSFLVANLHKFQFGGWFTLLLTSILAFIMYTWYRGREIKKKFLVFVKIAGFADTLRDIHNDESIPKYATNLVYITRADRNTDIESKIQYSIINKQPKRADKYWFVHLHFVDDPKKLGYTVETLIPNVLYRIELQIGFKVQPRINLFFRQVIEDLVKHDEIDMISNYESLRKHNILGDFKFVVIERIQNYDFDFQPFDQFIMDVYKFIKKIGISDQKAFGLDTSNVIVEKVPLESEVILEKFKKLNEIKRIGE